MRKARNSCARVREFITTYYIAHGRVPGYEALLHEFGYSSRSTVHYHLKKLVDSGFLQYGVARYEAGPLLVGAAGRGSLPAALLKEFSSSEDVQVLEVGEGWVLNANVKRGDLIVVGTREPVRPSSPVVLRRGHEYVFTEGDRVRAGWESIGVVFGQYRPYAKPTIR